MIKFIPAVLVMTLLGACGSLFLKKASGAGGIGGMLRSFDLYLGGALYFTSAILNIILLRYLDYSTVLPMTSVTYIWTMLLSYFVLSERITRLKIGGIIFIIAGLCLISAGG